MKRIDMTGATFGAWTVIRQGPHRLKRITWVCRCICGVIKNVEGVSLRDGDSRSCGCVAQENTRKRLTTHGMTGTPIFNIWKGMQSRCKNPNTRSFPHYGERGISVCERWITFEAFFEDMGPSWAPGLTIERDDNDKGYEPGNCRWVPKSEQSRNRRTNHALDTPWGVMTIAEAARKAGISWFTLRNRVKKGWPQERLFEPARGKHEDSFDGGVLPG